MFTIVRVYCYLMSTCLDSRLTKVQKYIAEDQLQSTSNLHYDGDDDDDDEEEEEEEDGNIDNDILTSITFV